MTRTELNAFKDGENQKDFTSMKLDNKHLRICPICGLVGLYSHGRKEDRWVHKQEHDRRMVFFIDFCEQTPDGRICRYVGSAR